MARVKSSKGWNYRLTLCDKDGIRVYDDFMDPAQLMEAVPRYVWSDKPVLLKRLEGVLAALRWKG